MLKNTFEKAANQILNVVRLDTMLDTYCIFLSNMKLNPISFEWI